MPFLMRDNEVLEADASMKASGYPGSIPAWNAERRSVLGLYDSELDLSMGKAQPKRLCGSAECATVWTRPWRNRRRPIFEGQWGCSGRCVLTMVQAAVRRERGESSFPSQESLHRHRVPLGLLMLAQGWISHSQLQQALAAQREAGTGRIGDWLIRECGLSAEQVTRGLSMQWGCPMLTTDGFSPETMARLVPKIFVERFGSLPLRVAGSRILYLGFADRLNASVALALEQMTRLKVESGVVDGTRFAAAKSRLLACDGIDTKLESFEDKDAMAARITAVLEQNQPIASRLVRLHQYYWLRLWLETGAVSKTGGIPAVAEDIKDHVFTVGSPQ
jgi:Type II secretion system (T2SS), protein E, N-terminal domain